MTGRERNLGLAVITVIVVTLIGRNFGQLVFQPQKQETAPQITLQAAAHLLAAEGNIQARYQASQNHLRVLEKHFLTLEDPEQAEIELLGAIEAEINSCGLAVDSKSTLQISADTIGVTLEGKTAPLALTRFLYNVSRNRYGFEINRLQIHSLPDETLLSYQIVLVSLLVERKGEAL